MAQQKQPMPRQKRQLQPQRQPSDTARGDKESGRQRDTPHLPRGPKVVGKYPADPLAAHEMLERGLPNAAIKHLLGGMTTLAQESIESAIGMSVRTRQRREKHPTELDRKSTR